LSYGYKKERSVAFKIRQNPFSAGGGDLPRTSLGSSRRSPRPPLGTYPPSALDMRLLWIPARSTPMLLKPIRRECPYMRLYSPDAENTVEVSATWSPLLENNEHRFSEFFSKRVTVALALFRTRIVCSWRREQSTKCRD